MVELQLRELLARSLLEAGITRVYGIIGTSVLDFIDTLYDYRDKIDFVTTRHEQVAASAADAHARVTGRPGAAVVHAGPGFLNTAISLGVALRDRVPLLLITGGVRRRLRGTGAWLEVDQEQVARGVAKAYYRVESGRSAPDTIMEALHTTLEPPRGPVVLEVPEDTWKEKASVDEGYFKALRETPTPEPGEAGQFAEDALALLEDSRRPLILACGELALDPRFQQEKLMTLAERLGAPVVVTGNGRGACPEDHPHCLGRVGFGGGSLVADAALEHADLVLVLGNEYDDITTYGYNLQPEGDVLVASLDPLVESRPAVYEHYKADPVAALDALLERLEAVGARGASGWEQVLGEARRKWRAILEEALKRDYKGLPNPARFFTMLDRLLPRSRIITAGQGTHILYTYAFTRIYRPASFLAATNLGAMGYALPAGIGAAQAMPGRPVVTVVGDGDFMMTVQDLETIAREKIPVRIVLVNDNSYKVLYLRQVIQLGGRVYETLLGNPDFQRLAEAFGIPYARVSTDSKAEEAARLVAEASGPLLVELPVRPDDLPPLNLEYTLRMSQ